MYHQPAPAARSTNTCPVQKYYGGLTRQAKVAVPFRVRPSLRGRRHLINDSSKPSPGEGQAAERRLPQCPSAKRRVPQRIISPPCQSSRCRRYPYACHAPKGLGRGAPEGKGYATTSGNSSLGGAALGDPRGLPWGALPTALNRPSG